MRKSRRRSASIERERARADERADEMLDADAAYLVEKWHLNITSQNRSRILQDLRRILDRQIFHSGPEINGARDLARDRAYTITHSWVPVIPPHRDGKKGQYNYNYGRGGDRSMTDEIQLSIPLNTHFWALVSTYTHELVHRNIRRNEGLIEHDLHGDLFTPWVSKIYHRFDPVLREFELPSHNIDDIRAPGNLLMYPRIVYEFPDHHLRP